MLRIDKSRNAAPLLHFCDHVQRHGCLTGGFRSIDLNDPSSGDAAKPECDIKAQGSGGDRLNIHLYRGVAKFHDRTLAVLFLYL